MSPQSLVRFDLDAEDSPQGHFDFSVRTVPKSLAWIALVAFSLFGVIASVSSSGDIGIIIAGCVMGCIGFVGFTLAARREHRFHFDGKKLHVESGSSARSYDVDECEAFYSKKERKVRTQTSTGPSGTSSVSTLWARIGGEDKKLVVLGTMSPWVAEYLTRHVCRPE